MTNWGKMFCFFVKNLTENKLLWKTFYVNGNLFTNGWKIFFIDMSYTLKAFTFLVEVPFYVERN